jgi:hypothetical protein
MAQASRIFDRERTRHAREETGSDDPGLGPARKLSRDRRFRFGDWEGEMKLWNYGHVSGYLRWAKAAFALVNAGGQVSIRRWDDPIGLDEFRRKFCEALNNRINLKGGRDLRNVLNHRGRRARKFDQDYETGFYRDQRRVRDIILTRLRVYQFETREVRARFGHLLATHEED